MALSLQNALFVRQKAFQVARSANAELFHLLKSFFLDWAMNRGNEDLQFIPFTEAECGAAGGTVKVTGSGKVYVVYIKKKDTATANYFKLYDSATDDVTQANARLALPLTAAKQEKLATDISGLPFTNGLVVTQHTTLFGETDGADGGDGFIIVGA